MSVASAAVEPAFLSVPSYAKTSGPDVADLADLAGFAPDPEQRMGLDAIFAVDGRGRSVAFETAVVCCRQNLKTGLFKQATLGWLFFTNERLVVWSAHEFRTAQEAFRDIEDLIAGSDWLRREVKQVYRGNGDEAIELTSGARLIFKARTKGGGRGLSGAKVILDEAFALQPMHMGALLPTLSAQTDPQVLYGSSAGLGESGVLRGVRDRGRSGADRRLAYLEWCAPGPAEACDLGETCTHSLHAVGCGMDKPELWQVANPAMGRRISREYIAAERRALPPEEFGRERLGWWDEPLSGLAPIGVDVWMLRADRASKVLNPVAFGVDVAAGQAATAVAVAGRRDDGRVHGELVEHRAGTGWVVQRLVDLAQRWQPCVLTVNPGTETGALIRALNEAGFVTEPAGEQWRLQLLGAREYGQACGALVADVRNDRWRHLDQAPLNAAVEGARTRPLADAWAWSRKDSAMDISPLVAVTNARYGFSCYGVGEPTEPVFAWA